MPIGERLAMHMREFARRGHLGRTEYVKARIEAVKRRFQPEVQEGIFTPPDVLDPEMNARLRRVADGLFAARERYRPTRAVSCDVLLLKASIPFDWPGSVFEPLYGWREFTTGRIDSMVVPGEHLQMFRTENDQILAEILLARLRELESEDGETSAAE
jgi:thioesterase domain-containing protein